MFYIVIPTNGFTGIEKTMNFDKERPIRMWLDLDNVLGIIAGHRLSKIVWSQKNLAEAALA